jgi:NAD(P) transhydrogenase subunit alpha
MEAIDPFVFRLSIFVLAIFVGYFVVWSVTPALHTPLMAVTNAISSVIVVGALVAVAVPTHYKPSPLSVTHADYASDGTIHVSAEMNGRPATQAEFQDAMHAAVKNVIDPGYYARAGWTSKILGFFALILASVNIFGGFLVTQRMLAMYKKKEK